MKNGLKIDEFGNKFYYLNDKPHREDGPAIELNTGSKFWYQNAKLHRTDGPAVIYGTGRKEWYYHDKYINCSSQEEFEKIIKLRVFL